MKNVFLVDNQEVPEDFRIDLLLLLEAYKVKYTNIDLDASRCPVCGLKKVNKARTVALFAEMVTALRAVYGYCKYKNSYVFERKEVKERYLAPLGENVTARFGDWKLFGGLLYTPTHDGKEKKGHYAFDVERTEAFLANKIAIPTKLILYKDGRAPESFDYLTLSQIPGLGTSVADGKYTAI